MTPADVAMKAALDESARYADSPPTTASSANPLVGRTSPLNVTSLGPHFGKSSHPVDTWNRPSTPHITLHQFHKHQHSPAPSSPDIDYKRVRRKQSFTSLGRVPSDENRSPAQHTSSSTSLQARGSKSLLPSLLPPVPPTQLSQSSPYSPSLSSTVDTLQSTPTHSPIQRVFWPLPQWGGIDYSGTSEPIRTKRKFLPLKPAKRLPHHEVHRKEGESIWEVHAAVIDVGFDEVNADDLGGEVDDSAGEKGTEEAQDRPVDVSSSDRASRRKGRIVRFEDSQPAESSESEPDVPASQRAIREATEAPTLSSNFSLSKFQFSAPPGSNWQGTFGHLSEPNSPASPATLQYRGVSFDVVNPHTSLLLGVSDIETPAEIDGLLDNYFDRNTFEMLPHDDNTRERSSSQYSIQTTGSNGRQRILYDDPDSARRNIMRLRGTTSQQSFATARSQGDQSDIPPMPSTTPPSIPLPTPARRPGTPANAAHQRIRVHPKFSEVLGLDTEGSSRVPRYTSNYESLDDAPAAAHRSEFSTHETHCTPALADAQDDDRPNSLYPHSRRSYPFDLTLDDDEDDLEIGNVEDMVAGRRTSAARGNHGTDFAIYEDADDANATQTTLEQETTLGHILSHYNYPRPTIGAFAAPDQFISPYQDTTSQSTSIDVARGGQYASNNPFASAQDPREDVTYGRVHQPTRAPGPPARAMPTPPSRRARGQGPSLYDPELIATDQTYGSTGQLLRLTPQTDRFAARGYHNFRPSTTARHDQRHDQGFEEVAITPAFPGPTVVPPPAETYDADKENTPPQTARPASTLSVTPGQEPVYYDGPRRIRGPATVVDLPAHSQGSPGVHRDDSSIWESTQSSQSRESLAGTARDLNAQVETSEDIRPSEDSYANTSIAGSNVRLSLPRPDFNIPMPPPSTRRAWPATVARQSTRLAARHQAWTPQTFEVKDDEDRAREILEEKLVKDAVLESGQRTLGDPHRDQERHASNMRQLEEIRQKNPSAVERAVKAISEGYGQLSPMQPSYTPQTSTSRFPTFGLGRTTPDSRYSETRGLLAEHAASPYSNRRIRFSETANTFQTTRQMPSFVTSPPVKGYSPLTPPPVTPPVAAHVRDLASTPSSRISRAAERRASTRPLAPESIELQPMSRRGRVSRVAMSSQTELRPLQLAESTQVSGMTGRLTDQQFAEAEGTWSMRPGRTEDQAHTRVLLRQSDSSPEQVNQLASAQDVRSRPVRRIQWRFTRPYYRGCILFPVAALIFGCGGLDWRMRQMTGGRIREMAPKAKKRALRIFAPLGLILYAVVVLMITLIVYIAKD